MWYKFSRDEHFAKYKYFDNFFEITQRLKYVQDRLRKIGGLSTPEQLKKASELIHWWNSQHFALTSSSKNLNVPVELAPFLPENTNALATYGPELFGKPFQKGKKGLIRVYLLGLATHDDLVTLLAHEIQHFFEHSAQNFEKYRNRKDLNKLKHGLEEIYYDRAKNLKYDKYTLLQKGKYYNSPTEIRALAVEILTKLSLPENKEYWSEITTPNYQSIYNLISSHLGDEKEILDYMSQSAINYVVKIVYDAIFN